MPAPRPDLQVSPTGPSGAAAVLDRAASRLAATLRTLDADARRVRPWLGDPVSAHAADRYAVHAAEGADAAIDRVRALHAELIRARDAITSSDRGYASTEDAITRSWGPR